MGSRGILQPIPVIFAESAIVILSPCVSGGVCFALVRFYCDPMPIESPSDGMLVVTCTWIKEGTEYPTETATGCKQGRDQGGQSGKESHASVTVQVIGWRRRSEQQDRVRIIPLDPQGIAESAIPQH